MVSLALAYLPYECRYLAAGLAKRDEDHEAGVRAVRECVATRKVSAAELDASCCESLFRVVDEAEAAYAPVRLYTAWGRRQ